MNCLEVLLLRLLHRSNLRKRDRQKQLTLGMKRFTFRHCSLLFSALKTGVSRVGCFVGTRVREVSGPCIASVRERGAGIDGPTSDVRARRMCCARLSRRTGWREDGGPGRTGLSRSLDAVMTVRVACPVLPLFCNQERECRCW